ncbi:helix-turn-helix domain-containing protein [Brevibacillus invocatus]|uniref:helix-turn-helix domain-containing protein n=2 Tax=Brevibacillus invocatus TaxID=173959 RepID=UPI001FECF7D1|nr:helix-turn-helix domain-containing protein [Brevibacillus invocatus]
MEIKTNTSGAAGDGMKRIDLIYQKLMELGSQNKVSASDLAKMMGLARANVSNDLNQLWKEDKVE